MHLRLQTAVIDSSFVESMPKGLVAQVSAFPVAVAGCSAPCG